jgi:hypothetical protein
MRRCGFIGGFVIIVCAAIYAFTVAPYGPEGVRAIKTETNTYAVIGGEPLYCSDDGGRTRWSARWLAAQRQEWPFPEGGAHFACFLADKPNRLGWMFGN